MSAEYAGLFALDGVLETSGGGSFEGRANIATYIAARQAARATHDSRLNQTRHHLASVYIFDVEGDRARANSYFQVLTPYGCDHWGSYRDELVHVDGEWRFARRVVTIDGQSEVSWRAQVPATSVESHEDKS